MNIFERKSDSRIVITTLEIVQSKIKCFNFLTIVFFAQEANEVVHYDMFIIIAEIIIKVLSYFW